MADEEYQEPPPPYVWFVKSSENGKLYFTVVSDRSEEWKREFESRWNDERERRKQSISELGEVTIINAKGSVPIVITETRLNSEEWQVGIALKLMAILDRELNEPKGES